MKIEFLQINGNNTRLILIFAGWSSSPRFYSDIRPEGWDVAVVFDYTDTALDTSLLDAYSTIYLYAWSMGVWAAETAFPPKLATHAVAVNGTPCPVDSQTGIPEDIFFKTRDTLDERNLKKFRRRMASDNIEFKEILEKCTESDDIERLKDELTTIAGHPLPTDRTPFPWSRVYVSENDLIFPFENQKRAWESAGITDIQTLPGAHCAHLRDIVFGSLHSVDKVGEHFKASMPTYESSAEAQRLIAEHLMQHTLRFTDARGGRCLEVGPATGILSREIRTGLCPESIDYIDLFPVSGLCCAPVEHYHCGDAESWICKQTERWDYIMSASTIQWFFNPGKFFGECASRLYEKGTLACSTFLPGNLHELDCVRPYGLLYLTEERIRNLAERYFAYVETFTEDITLHFGSTREMLAHISRTGVKGDARSPYSHQEIIRRLSRSGNPTLTFKVLYILARKE